MYRMVLQFFQLQNILGKGELCFAVVGVRAVGFAIWQLPTTCLVSIKCISSNLSLR